MSWPQTIKILCVVVILLCVASTASMVVSSVAAKTTTAVRPLTISQITYHDNGTVTLRATFDNIQMCRSIGIAWYVGSPECSFDQASLVLTR